MNRRVLLSTISLLITCLIPVYVAKADSGITHAVLVHGYDEEKSAINHFCTTKRKARTTLLSQINLYVYPTSPSVNQILYVTAEVQDIETLTEGRKVDFYANGTWLTNKLLDSSGVATVSYIPKTLGDYAFTALILDGVHIYYGKITVQVGELRTDYMPYISVSAVILAFVLIVVYIMIQRTARAPEAIR